MSFVELRSEGRRTVIVVSTANFLRGSEKNLARLAAILAILSVSRECIGILNIFYKNVFRSTPPRHRDRLILGSKMIENHENLIIFRTFSKAFGLAGLRIGFMISNSRNIGYFSKSRSIVESNNLSMAVAEYMLNNLNIMNDHVKTVRAGGRYFKERLDSLKIRYHGGNVTNGILLFLDGRLEAKQLVEGLNEMKAKWGVLPLITQPRAIKAS